MKFRKPSELKKDVENTETISARVKVSTKEELQSAAKEAGITLSVLVGSILEDYAKYLRDDKS